MSTDGWRTLNTEQEHWIRNIESRYLFFNERIEKIYILIHSVDPSYFDPLPKFFSPQYYLVWKFIVNAHCRNSDIIVHISLFAAVTIALLKWDYSNLTLRL